MFDLRPRPAGLGLLHPLVRQARPVGDPYRNDDVSGIHMACWVPGRGEDFPHDDQGRHAERAAVARPAWQACVIFGPTRCAAWPQPQWQAALDTARTLRVRAVASHSRVSQQALPCAQGRVASVVISGGLEPPSSAVRPGIWGRHNAGRLPTARSLRSTPAEVVTWTGVIDCDQAVWTA